MTVVELYLTALAVIFFVPWLIWRLLRIDSWMPLVVAQILSGVLIGPGILGVYAPSVYSSVFTPAVIGALNGVAWWAVSLFVFTAGIELNLRAAWQDRRQSVVIAGSALVSPLLFGSLFGLVLLQFVGWQGARAADWQFVLGIGMASAVTALPILVVLMEKMNILRTDLGQRVLRCASLDDILIWAVLAVILMDWHRLGNQAVFLIVYAIAAWQLRTWMPRFTHQDRWSVAIIWLVVCALLADWAGLHYMVGAFLAGVIIDSEWFDQQQLDSFRQTILLVMMPVFFLSTGLRTSWELGGLTVVLVALTLFVLQFAGKQIGVRIAGRYLGWDSTQTKIIGYLLQTKALIEIIFASVLLDKGIITSAMFTVLLLMALISTVVTTPLVRPLLKPAKY
jgi:Kef-type K+ transport system membrane component KefB